MSNTKLLHADLAPAAAAKPKDAKSLALGMRRQRILSFAEAAANAKIAHRRRSRINGNYHQGRDEMGLLVETADLDSLRVRVSKWCVVMSFHREDHGRLHSHGRDLEHDVKAGRIPKKAVWVKSHIIAAVRTCKHIRQNYQGEVGRIDAMLEPLDMANAEMVAISGKPDDAALDNVVKCLRAFKASLADREVVVLAEIATAQVDRTIDSFQRLKTLPENKRGFHLKAVCADFTALRNRVGLWRFKQIGGLMDFSEWRENSLRIKRDEWLERQLIRFAEDPVLACRLICGSSGKHLVISKAEEELGKRSNAKIDAPQFDEAGKKMTRTKQKAFRKEAREKRKEAWDGFMAYLDQMRASFVVDGRDREGIKEFMARLDRGIIINDGKRHDVLYGQYDRFITRLNEGDRPSANRELGILKTFIEASSPRYIIDELRINPDPYLAPVLTELEAAVESCGRYGKAKADNEGATAESHLIEAKSRFIRAREMLIDKTSPQASLPFED